MSTSSILLRTDHQTHRSLLEDAKNNDKSLNELCRQRVALPSMLQNYPAELTEAAILARKITKNKLAALIIFGSWAKGTQTDTSDLDILIVLKSKSTVTRQLYRDWQKTATKFKVCEPHFVVLPEDETQITSLWAEVAIDGSILFDTNNCVLQYLREVRMALINQELIPKQAHGQTYWVHRKAS